MTRMRLSQILVVLVVLLLVAGLAGGCAAEEPSGDQTPGTGAGSDGSSDGGTTGDSATRPAGDVPEGATHAIADVLDTPSDGVEVVLVGDIAEMLDAENFMLKDSTGEVYVDGDNDFGVLSAGDTVTVTGTVKVEDSPARVEIQATAVERR